MMKRMWFCLLSIAVWTGWADDPDLATVAPAVNRAQQGEESKWEDVDAHIPLRPQPGSKRSILAYLSTVFMEEHRRLTDDVRLTRYADGSRIVVNYAKTPYTFEGQMVDPVSCRIFR